MFFLELTNEQVIIHVIRSFVTFCRIFPRSNDDTRHYENRVVGILHRAHTTDAIYYYYYYARNVRLEETHVASRSLCPSPESAPETLTNVL